MLPACFVIGLTGGIGSGKSTVAELFVKLGAAHVDTDAIAHTLTLPAGAAIDAIRTAFGEQIIDSSGALDRAAMRERVFRAPHEKQRLEGILHPLIRTATKAALAAVAKQNPPYTILSVPLLFESMGYREEVARTLVVDCPQQMQVERIFKRSALSEEMTWRIIATQISRAARLQLADDVVVNVGTLPDLEMQVTSLHARYLALARRI